MSVHDGLEGIIGIRGLGSGRLAAVSYALRPNIYIVLFCANGEGPRVFVVCFLHTSSQICFVDAWPAHATFYLSTVTLAWVGAPNQRALLKDRDAGVGLSIDVKPKVVYFLPSAGGQVFLSSVCYKQAPKYVFIRRLAGPRHMSPTKV